jgi:hypothetical protein
MRSSGSIGDRREHVRFQVMGALSSSLVSSEPLEFLNLGTSGALVEAAAPLPVNAEYRMQVILPSHVSEVTAKVRRVATVDRTNGSVRFQMGVEFLGICPEAEDAIARLVADA